MIDFPVVGIGASAGGLQALMRFFDGLPANNGMAFVIVLHLSPKHESNLDSLLQRATKMPVIQVNQPIPIKKENVYVIPPNKHLSMHDGCLTLAEAAKQDGRHVAIDLFFRTLADTHKERAIGIVLSGTGADGSVGLSRLKEQGGITIAQNPSDAEYDSMPLAAIATGIVDFVLPVAEIPQKLVDIQRVTRILKLPPVGDDDDSIKPPLPLAPVEQSEQLLQEIIAILRTRTGHDFRHYKRATVLRRIERRLQVRGVPDLLSYRKLLEVDAQESAALLKDMLIGVTNFFRDREAFEALERGVIPRLFEDKQSRDQVRVWVTACATGEEAYSTAMQLADFATTIAKPPRIQVFASDIDDNAIRVARHGDYPESIVTDVPTTRLRQFFTKENQRYRIRKEIRDSVLFASHNLLQDPPFSKQDLVTCRNLLIYLNRDVQAKVLELFHVALNPGGFLFLGSSESADMLDDFFTPFDKKARIYRARPYSPRIVHRPLTLPLRGLTPIPTQAEKLPHNERNFSYAEVHQRILSQYAPPSVVVNREADIVHMSAEAGRFLRHIGGEPSHNLVSLVLPELRVELRSALFQAWQSGKSVEARRVQLMRNGHPHYVNMTARPFYDQKAGVHLALVLFDEVEQTMRDESETASADKKDAVLVQLEQELQSTREQLQDTIEQADVTIEELKGANEELQAVNEELRSATEELEANKEELQSTNEELIAVNSELKAQIDETNKASNNLKNLVASAEIATIFVDSAMRIKLYTPRAADIFNLIPSDTGRPLSDITHRLDYDKLAEDAITSFDRLQAMEREVSSFDGRSYIVRTVPYRTTEDRIDGAILTFFDITRLRQTEEQVRAAEQRMRLVVESTRDYAIITTNGEGLVASWNKGAARLFGYAATEMLGQPIDILYTPEERSAGVPDRERRTALETGRAEDERWHTRKDGTAIYCTGVTTPLLGGEFAGYSKIARDETQRKIAEDQQEANLNQVQARRDESQRVNALKDQFLAIMSHELRQPLNLIHINAEMLLRRPEIQDSAVNSKAMEMIRKSALNQAKIIDDLLDLSRLNTGKLSLDMARVDLTAAVQSIAEVAQADATAHGLTITTASAQEHVMILADQVRVEQILLNLLSNAIKFTPSGGRITVNIGVEESAARLDVTDTGRGIAPGLLPELFNMFQQGTSVTTRHEAGLGIGLALVRQLAELHHGRVEATSAGRDKGARFSVWFPLYKEIDAHAARQHPTRASIAGLSILLVDDMEDVVTTLGMLLEAEGATVHASTSVTKALELLGEHAIDLVVSDIAMPVVDGYAFIRKLRAEPQYSKVPAIALTGLSSQNDIARAYEAGFSAHISKPPSIDILVATAAELYENFDGNAA